MTNSPKILRNPKDGDVFAIPLSNGKYGFGQVCKEGGSCAYFDLQSDDFLPVETIIKSPVAFRVATVIGAAKKGGWLKLGNSPLEGSLNELASYRNQPVCSNQLYLVKGNNFIPATYDEVKDLESLSTWNESQVVERLLNHFEGRPDPMTERLKKIKVYHPETKQELDPETGQPIPFAPYKSPQTFAEQKPVPNSKPATAATFLKIQTLLQVYEQLIPLIQVKNDKRLNMIVASLIASTMQIKEWLAAGVDAKFVRELVKGLCEGLHEMPELLVKTLPDYGVDFVSELEIKLGRKFTDY